MGFSHAKIKKGKIKELQNKAQASKNIVREAIYWNEARHGKNPKISSFIWDFWFSTQVRDILSNTAFAFLYYYGQRKEHVSKIHWFLVWNFRFTNFLFSLEVSLPSISFATCKAWFVILNFDCWHCSSPVMHWLFPGQNTSVDLGSRAKNELIFLQCMWIMPCLSSA